MPFIPVPLCVEIDINQTLYGERVQNTLYGISFGGVTPAGLELLAGEIITWVGTELYPNLASNIQLTEVQVRDLATADGAFFVGTPTVPVIGTASGVSAPGSIAACVSFRTGFIGRSRRGRNYVAGLPESGLTGNQIDPGLGGGLFDAYSVLLGPGGPFVASGFAWVVVSRYSGVDPATGKPIPRAAGQATLITAVQIDSNIDSQRRRLAGRGV